MKKLTLLLLIMITSSCTDCDDDMPQLSNCSISGNTIINATQYQSITTDVFIEDLQISGDCLTIVIGGSGCDASTWELNIIDEDNAIGTNPSQRNVALEFINNEACLAAFTREFVFDVASLQTTGNQVSLNFTNSGTGLNQVTYNY